MKNFLRSIRLRSFIVMLVLSALMASFGIDHDREDLHRGYELFEATVQVISAVAVWFIGLKTPDKE